MTETEPRQGKMDCFGMTDIGRRRSTNEDQFLISDLNRSMQVQQTSLGLDHQTRLFSNSQGKLFLVADGMGGHDGGERASQLAVDSLVSYMLNTMPWIVTESRQDELIHREFRTAMEHCQSMLREEVKATPQRRGMGTTLTMAYLMWPKMYVIHVGDSRCYMHRDGKLHCLTRDHTLAALASEQEPSATPPQNGSNVLWNVVCADDDTEMTPDISLVELQMNDSLLLCTDGLYKHLSDEKIRQTMEVVDSAEQLCRELIVAANEEGGTDNITVVTARFLEGEPAMEQALEATKQSSPDPSVIETAEWDVNDEPRSQSRTPLEPTE